MRHFRFLCSVIFLVFFCAFPVWAVDQVVYGPVTLTINAWHTHFSSHSFKVTDPQKGILSLHNDFPDKKVNSGLVWFNGALISVDLKKNPVFEKEVDLKQSNYLIVFLEGRPKASATLEIRTKDVNPPPEADFLAEPASIRPGQTSTLSWTTQNTTSASIDQGIGSVALNGSMSVSPLVNTAYTLTAQGPGGTITKTATILVVNQAPAADPQSLSLNEDSNQAITLTGSDADNDPLTYSIVINPGHGTLSGTAPNVTYTPTPLYHGTDSFTFKVNDGFVDSAPAAINLAINHVNHAPVAQDDTAQTNAGQSISINVLANDSDIDGDTLSIQSFTQPSNGTAVNNNNGSFTYTPKANFSGSDSFSYTIFDGQGATASAQVTIIIKDPNSPPTASLSASPQTIQKGGSTTLTWSSTKASQAHLDNGLGNVGLIGSQLVTPEHTTTYTLTVIGPTGVASASVIVTVLGNPLPQPDGSFGQKYEDLTPPDATIEKYDPKRFSLVTGKILDLTNAPIPDVSVTVHSHPEYGTAKTDHNGQYTIPVEGGGIMTFVFQKSGFLTSHRQVNVPWNDFAVGPTIQMLPEDPKATSIVFDGNAANIQTHQSTIVTDEFGSRSCTMVFSGDNQAYAVDENGNDIGVLPKITTRATEYVTPDSMPAILPPSSAYTYCAELSVDGAQRVRFAKPVITWVDNFLGFPVGEIVPVGYYDRDKGFWVASDNGVVVKLLDTDSNGIVDSLDSNNDSQPDDLNNNGSFTDEVQGLNDPSKYQPGQTFWRVAIQHFTTWDCNWGSGPDGDAIVANPDGIPNADQLKDNDCSTGCGSSIDDRSRILHQDIPIPGTDMTLHYASNRTSGNKFAITVPASGTTVPQVLRKIVVQVLVAGQTLKQELDPLPNQKAVFYWNGLDSFGREVDGPVNAHIMVGFQYRIVYYSASTSVPKAFGSPGQHFFSISINARQSMNFWRESDLILYATGGQGRGVLAEGWTLTAHHYLSSVNPSILYKGDGTIISNNKSTMNTFAGNGLIGSTGDGGPAQNAQINQPWCVALDPIGNVYVGDNAYRIRKVDKNFIITTVVGTGQPGFSGDGGPAINAKIAQPVAMTIDAAGNIYFGDWSNFRIRKVDTNGIITTVVGNGLNGFSGDNGPAINASISPITGIDVDSAGNLYLADCENHRIRKVDTNGIITTIAGNGHPGYSGDGGPAIDATIASPEGIAVDPTGNLYFITGYSVRKVDTSGIITRVAGRYDAGGFSGDGGSAINAKLLSPYNLTFDRVGNFYIADTYNWRIRKVDTSGIIATVAGNGQPGFNGDGGVAVNTTLSQPYDIAVDAKGYLYIADHANNRIRKVGPPYAFQNLINNGEIAFADENNLGYIMSSTGLHKYTLDLDSGVTRLQFGYDSNTQLVSITDRFNSQTSIQRNGQGIPISITSPDGLVTTLTVDASNHLTKVAYEDGGYYDFTYTSDGLMTQKIDPDKHHYTYQYDPTGKITQVSDELGGEWRFARQAQVNGDIITQKTTKEGDSTTYVDHSYSTGAYTSLIQDQTGAQTTYSQSGDGLYVQKNLPCGMQLNVINDIDPVYKYEMIKQMQTRSPAGLAQTTQYAKTYQDTNNDQTPDLITDTITVNGQAVRMVNNTLLGQTTLQSPMGRTVTSNYDPITLLTSNTQIPGLFATSYNYDTKGRLTKLKTNTRETSFAYNPRGFLDSITDPKNQTTSYDYDPVGRIKTIHRPDQSTVSFQYDLNGNMTVLTTPNQIDHQFTYNKVDCNDSYITPKSGTYQYLYDRDRRLTAIKFPSSFELKYIYDQGRLIQIQTEDQVIGLSYLCSDKVGSISNGQDAIAYGYDGSLVTSETLTGTLNQTLGYTYNNNFQVQGFTYAGGTQNYTYDNDQLLTKAGDFNITRDAQNGLPTSVVGQSLKLDRTFNGYGEISSEKYSISNLQSQILNLTRNDNGQIITKQITVNGITSNFAYTYDPMGRLLTVIKDGTLVEEYRYGANGARSYEMNLLRGIPGRNYDYSSEDQVLTTGDFSYKYDVDGFLAIKTVSGATTTYEYATRGELMKVTLPDGKVIEYINDPLGRRIAKKINGTLVEKYLWQGMTRLLAIFDNSDNVLMRFIYVDGRLPVAMISGGNTFYLAYDQVGSIISVADASGNVIKSLTYDSFGNIVLDSAPSVWIPFGFAGGLYDPDTGLVRFGSREYSPEIGKWTAKDILLFNAGDIDLYGYCLSDPINWIDSLGLEKLILLDPVKDASLYNSAVNAPDVLGMLTVYSHGNPYRIDKMMADQLADFIQKSGKWKPGMPIKLSSCRSAEGENSIAQELAKLLQTDVIGAEGKVWNNILTGNDFGTPMPPLINNIPFSNGIGIPNFFNPGRWVLFSGSAPYAGGTTWEP